MYMIIVIRVVLYGCETWSLTVREEHRLRMFENRVLRRREEVAVVWRRLHHEELHNLYTSPNMRVIKSRRIRWTRKVARMGHEKCIQNFGRKM
jgi:hypothetical protein